VLNQESSEVINFILITVTYFLPALIANGAPVVFIGKLVKRPRPLDRNVLFIDGKPILGPNKTLEGFIIGVASGLIVGVAYSLIFNNVNFTIYGLTMGLGAMVGDAFNSFIKRRLSIRSGDPFIPMDQLSFIVSSYLLVKVLRIDRLCGINLGLKYFSMIVVIVLILHPLSNLVSYVLGLKDKPW